MRNIDPFSGSVFFIGCFTYKLLLFIFTTNPTDARWLDRGKLNLEQNFSISKIK